MFFVLNQEWYVFHFADVQKLQCLGQKLQDKPSSSFLQWGTLPHSVYIGRHWRHSRDKTDQAFPLRFCILKAIKNWTVGRPGNKATTEAHTDQHASMLCMVHCILYGGEYPLFATSLKKSRPLQDVTISLCRREREQCLGSYVHDTQYHQELSGILVELVLRLFTIFFFFFFFFCWGAGESLQLVCDLATSVVYFS